MQIKTILVIEGTSGYDSLSDFDEEIAEEWTKMGYEVTLFGKRYMDETLQLKEEIINGRRFDFIFSINKSFGKFTILITPPKSNADSMILNLQLYQ